MYVSIPRDPSSTINQINNYYRFTITYANWYVVLKIVTSIFLNLSKNIDQSLMYLSITYCELHSTLTIQQPDSPQTILLKLLYKWPRSVLF